MRMYFIFALLLLAAVPAAALQIGDGYNNGTYNSHNYRQSDNAFLTMQAKSNGVPVGTVISWPIASMPEDAENWLECDGRVVPSSYELAKIMTRTPDYRGQFLRGVGGKAGVLGAVQKESVYVPKSNAGNFFLNNIGLGFVLEYHIVDEGWGDENHWYDAYRNVCTQYNAQSSYTYNYGVSSNGAFSPHTYTTFGRVNILYSATGSTLAMPIEIMTKDEETRPENIAVRYLIRAQ